jgi:hypothetical protein
MNFKSAILELENMKISVPIYGQNNFNFRFAYQHLLYDMYNRDMNGNKHFLDPQYNYSNNIVNSIDILGINKYMTLRNNYEPFYVFLISHICKNIIFPVVTVLYKIYVYIIVN